MKIVKTEPIPSGWMAREGFENEWVLEEDRGVSQPLGTHVSRFDERIDYSGKTGFQCTLGEFAGRFCHVAPLRKTELEAVADCREFMEHHASRNGLKSILNECYYTKGKTWRRARVGQ